VGWALAADAVVIIHFAFVVFAVLGGLTLLWRGWMAWVHLPCAIWGALIEFSGWICPLTPLEIRFRELAGQAGYDGGFIEHYLLPILYPAGLTRGVQFVLGGLVVAINLVLYFLAWRVHRARARRER